MTMQGNAQFDRRSQIDEDDDSDEMDSAELENFSYALNARHHVSFQRRGPALLISFDAVPDQALALSQKHARLDALAREMDWSLLSLVSRGDTWFRDAEVITFFDALADGTLLDQFETVLFYGAGSGGHAALSYALAAPFSRILAMSPLPSEGSGATTDRYAPAAENLAVAEHVFVPQDPAHADGTLGAPNLMPLSCRHMGQKLEETLIDFGILDDVVCDAMDGVLTEAAFYRLLRARRGWG